MILDSVFLILHSFRGSTVAVDPYAEAFDRQMFCSHAFSISWLRGVNACDKGATSVILRWQAGYQVLQWF